MSRHDYRISICFSDEAVATLVAHWNPINLGCQGPMRTSQLRLTPYQLTITYKWTLPVSMQQVMILLSIRQFANKKKKEEKGGAGWKLCLAGLGDFVFVFCFHPLSISIGCLDLVRLCIILLGCDLIATSNQVEASLKCAWISLEDITYATFLQYLINHKETKTHMAWGNNWKIR